KGLLALGQNEVAQAINVPPRPRIAGAVDYAEGIRQFRRDECFPQWQWACCHEIFWCAQSERLAGSEMLQGEFGGMQINSPRGRAAIHFVSQNGQATFGGMYSNLVGAPGERLGGDQDTRAEINGFSSLRKGRSLLREVFLRLVVAKNLEF